MEKHLKLFLQHVSAMFGPRLKVENDDFFIGRYVIVPTFDDYNKLEEINVFDTGIYTWTEQQNEKADGFQLFFTCQTVEMLFLALS